MQKRSMITTGIILLCVANLAWDFITLVSEVRQIREEAIASVAIGVAEQIEVVYKIEDPVLLRQKLDLLQQQEKISFYMIKSDRKPASVSNPDVISPEFQAIVDGQVRTILEPKSNAPQAAYVGEKIGNEEVVIGRLVNTKFMEHLIAFNRSNFWRHFLVQALIMALIIVHSFRELDVLLKRMQWGSFGLAGGTAGAGFKFQESSTIASALEKVSQLQIEDKEDLERLRAQILPGAKNELLSNQEPPYEFSCIMVRVDINNSTAVFSDRNLIEVQRHWFDYFKVHCGEIAGRYQGFVHDELGDEVILYFKVPSPSDLAKASSLALASVRDIFRLSESIDHETDKKFNFKFRVKASVDQGPLRVFKSSFGQGGQDARLKIEGAGGDGRNPFLTTVRMLKFVEDKSVNSCILSHQVFQQVQDLVQSSILLDRFVPDIQDEQHYHLVANFIPWSQHGRLSPYFLSDEILKAHLDSCANPKVALSEKLDRINIVRGVSLGEASLPLQEALMSSLSYALNSKHPDDKKIVSSLVALTPQLISVSDLMDQARELLQACLKYADERVQANALEAWGKLDFRMDQIKKSLKVFRHNRSLANAIIATLKSEMDKPTLLLLSKMLQHKDEFMRAAGCFAVGEVVSHYQKTNAILLRSNPILQQQIKRVLELSADQNEMVRRQSITAKNKFQAA